MELAEIPVPDVLEDEALGRLAEALRPLIEQHGGGEGGVRGAAASIADDLDRLAGLERQVRLTVDQATLSAKEIVAYTLPPYWPFMLGASILLALSGLLVMDAPQWRLPFIALVGALLLAMGVHYAWRLYTRSRVIGPLQERFEAEELAARELFGDIAELERALQSSGFQLATDSFLPFAPPVRCMAGDGRDSDDARRRLAQFVTGDAAQWPGGEDAETSPG